MLSRYFPFVRWFPMKADALKDDLVAGITVALVLIPQSMAYAALAGLPVVYGLYAAFLPVIVASMWGASRFLHTGPVAMLSLMSAAALEPLAVRGSEEFIQLSVTLALMVGVMRLGLGGFRLGVLINLASHPVINGFTNAAALIIGLSLLNTFINVPMPRSDMFLRDLWQVLLQLPLTHWPTLAFGIATLVVLYLFRRYRPNFPGVLVVVILGTIVSGLVGFERSTVVEPDQITDTNTRAAFTKFAELEHTLANTHHALAEVRKNVAELELMESHDYILEAELLRLLGEEKGLKKQLYSLRVAVQRFTLTRGPDDAAGRPTYVAAKSSLASPASIWRFAATQDGQFKLSGGGRVVGDIPAGLPGFAVPHLDIGSMSALFGTAFVMALIGFMEATSISRALAAKSREKLDPNQELIGQGLANIVGSFFHSYTVSGSFSRSAVAASAGARSGFYAIISAMGVVIVMLFLTPYLHHLPQPVLAAIVMNAVFGLIDIKPLQHSWNVRRSDGVVGLITFFATLLMAPQLASGVLVGVVLTVLMFLVSMMQPRSEVLGRTPEGVLVGAESHNVAPISENYIVLRFDASLVFINSAFFEQAVMKSVSQFPKARAVLVIGSGINRIDATGEEKLRALASDLKAADITLMLSGLKMQVREALTRAGLDSIIGPENFFSSKELALRALAERFDRPPP